MPHELGLSIMQLNINSIRLRMTELKDLITTHHPDVVVINETNAPET